MDNIVGKIVKDDYARVGIIISNDPVTMVQLDNLPGIDLTGIPYTVISA